MTFPTMLVHPAQIVKPGVKTNRAGDQIKDWDNPTRTASKCWLWSKRASEEEGLDDESLLGAVLFLPSGADVKNEDRIETLNQVFRVIGPPKPKFTTAGLHHYEVIVEAELT